MAKAANDPKATARSPSAAIIPASGISWGREIIRAVRTDTVVELLLKFRYSRLHRLRRYKLTIVFTTDFSNPYTLTPEWAARRKMADAYMKGRRFPKADIAQTITFLTARSVSDPGAPATLDAGSIVTLFLDTPDAGPLRTLWRLPRTASAAVSPNEHRPFQNYAHRS